MLFIKINLKYTYKEADMHHKTDEYVEVKCSDTDKISEAIILKESAEQIRVELNGILMTFRKHRSNIFVCNMHGLEFVLNRS